MNRQRMARRALLSIGCHDDDISQIPERRGKEGNPFREYTIVIGDKKSCHLRVQCGKCSEFAKWFTG